MVYNVLYLFKRKKMFRRIFAFMRRQFQLPVSIILFVSTISPSTINEYRYIPGCNSLPEILRMTSPRSFTEIVLSCLPSRLYTDSVALRELSGNEMRISVSAVKGFGEF